MTKVQDGPYNIFRSGTRERVARVGVGSKIDEEARLEAWWGWQEHAYRKFADVAFEAIRAGTNPFTHRGEAFTWERDES